MSTTWINIAPPEDFWEQALYTKVKNLMVNDLAATEGRHRAGFVSRQTALGFRKPIRPSRQPEVDIGALYDLGS